MDPGNTSEKTEQLQTSSETKDHHGSPSESGFAQEVHADILEQGSAQKDQAKEKEPTNVGDGLRSFFKDLKVTDVALSAFTFLLVVVGIGQCSYLGQANDAAREAANVADRAAKAAETSAKVADQTLRLTLRPSIATRLPGGLNVGAKPFVAETQIINNGLTPAYDYHVRSAVYVVEYPMDPKFDYSQADDEPDQSEHQVISPHEAAVIKHLLPDGFDDNLLAKLRSENSRLVILGSIVFKDAFKDLHHVHFCTMYRLTANLSYTIPAFCPSWNDSD